MKRSLTRSEIEAQLAAKARAIQGHLEGLKEQSGVAADAVKVRAQEVGGHLQEAGAALQDLGDLARGLAPLALAGGLGLLWLGRSWRRRRGRRRDAADPQELARLSEAVAARLAGAERAGGEPGRGGPGWARILLAGAAGVALKVALDRVPWGGLGSATEA